MLEHAKKKARDIAKARVESGYANDKTQAISSSDYAEENTPAKHITEVEGADESTPKKKGGLQLGKKSVNSFQKKLEQQEMKGAAKKAPKKGMQLGKPRGTKKNQALQEMQKDIGDTRADEKDEQNVDEERKLAELAANPLTENVQIEIDEKISCQISKDGEIEKFLLQGVVYLTLTDPKKTHAELQLAHNEFKGLVFKVHPEIDKPSWNKKKLLKGKKSGDPDSEGISAMTKLDALHYRYTSKSEEDLPFTVSVFNSKKAGKNVITMEVEFNQAQDNLSFKELENITIGVNMSEDDVEVTNGDANYEKDEANAMLLWHVPRLHESESAVLSFASKAITFDDIFPLDVRFSENYSVIDMRIAEEAPKPMDALTGDEMSMKLVTTM